VVPSADGDPQRQSCNVCGVKDKFDYHVSDDLWRQVVPEEHRHHVVCLSCFDDFAHARGVRYGKDVRTLYFAGRGATLVFTRT
jgi:hypothetical protein